MHGILRRVVPLSFALFASMTIAQAPVMEAQDAPAPGTEPTPATSSYEDLLIDWNSPNRLADVLIFAKEPATVATSGVQAIGGHERVEAIGFAVAAMPR